MWCEPTRAPAWPIAAHHWAYLISCGLLPTQGSFRCHSCLFCCLHLLSEHLLEPVGQHCRRASFDDGSNFASQVDAAETREAAYTRQDHINDQALDVFV